MGGGGGGGREEVDETQGPLLEVLNSRPEVGTGGESRLGTLRGRPLVYPTLGVSVGSTRLRHWRWVRRRESVEEGRLYPTIVEDVERTTQVGVLTRWTTEDGLDCYPGTPFSGDEHLPIKSFRNAETRDDETSTVH